LIIIRTAFIVVWHEAQQMCHQEVQVLCSTL